LGDRLVYNFRNSHAFLMPFAKSARGWRERKGRDSMCIAPNGVKTQNYSSKFIYVSPEEVLEPVWERAG
jgi:hypothetical protein